MLMTASTGVVEAAALCVQKDVKEDVSTCGMHDNAKKKEKEWLLFYACRANNQL